MDKSRIIFEDENILLIDKPYGLIVNRSNTAKEKTLQDYIDEWYDFAGDDEEFVSRSGIVHRIDKDTSGVLLIAKDVTTFKNLLAQFKEREVHKEYIALVHGNLKYPDVEVDAPIHRNPTHRFRFAVVNEGKPAFTTIEKIKTLKIDNKECTLLKAFPKTGRTHQIRVHLTALGHPVVGDPIYCTRKLLEDGVGDIKRMMLHAYKITFLHPKTGKKVTFDTPLPNEFDL